MNEGPKFIKEAVKAVNYCKKIREANLRDGSLDTLLVLFYTPDARLSDLLTELTEKIKISNLDDSQKPSNFHVQIGQHLEKIAYLCLKSLAGISSIKSFQSPGPQYDFVVTGDNELWISLCQLFYFNNPRDILVEVKATKSPVDDQTFARLCSLLDLNLTRTAGIGVFFTLSGASGFPKAESKTRQRTLSDARLRQVMYMVSAKKPIVVFDKEDIFKLDQAGSFVKLLIHKIRDIEDLTGLFCSPDIERPLEVDLPKHLKDNID